MRRARPNRRQLGFALGAAAACVVVALLNAAQAVTGGPRWHFISALGFAAVALLWWFVAVRSRRHIDGEASKP